MRNCIIPFFLLTLSISFIAHGSSVQGTGHVKMQGSIIDTPCAIAINSREQCVDMSVLPIEQIMRDGRGPVHPFSIVLVNCVLARSVSTQPDRSVFRITFDGATTYGNLFAVRGQAQGVGLQLTDRDNNISIPGKQMPAGNLQPGNMTLNYTLRLVANRNMLRAGNYQATIRFKLDYY